MSFYDILWHMPYDIKCHQVCQYGYQKNRLDQTNWSKGCKIIFQEQNLTQNPKNWNCNISFVFFRRFLYNFQRICGGVKRSQNQKIFFLLAHTYDGAQKSRRTENLDNFYNFHTALLSTVYPKVHRDRPLNWWQCNTSIWVQCQLPRLGLIVTPRNILLQELDQENGQ